MLVGKLVSLHGGKISVDSVEPVSYTHLDVYKRQAEYSPFRQTDLIFAWYSE